MILPGSALDARVERRADGRLAIRLGSDTFAATVARRPTADGVDYVVFADGTSRTLLLVDPLDVTQYEAVASGEGAVR